MSERGAGSERKRRRGRGLDPVRTLRVMGRFVRRQVTGAGAAPGTLVHSGARKVDEVRLRILDYEEGRLDERRVESVEELFGFRDSGSVSWINVDGLHDVELVRELTDHFGLHPIVQEDIVQVGQRSKVEEYDEYLYVVVPMLSWVDGENGATGHVEEEQLSLLLGPRFVLTFQERYGDVFEPVRERIRSSNRRIRSRGPDYLAYALIDAVVDRYFHVLERMGERTEELELKVLDDPEPETMTRLHTLKREMLVLRRAAWPVRDTVNGLIRGESPLLEDPTRVFLRDVYDHAVQTIDTLESLREVVSSTIDLYLSHVGHKQNEIMKVLTVMASIFIPLTFLAGIYGMNFEWMPELGVRWAYPVLLGVMLTIGLGMVAYFYRKGWL